MYKRQVYNFFGVLREHSDISEEIILELSDQFKEGRTDAMLVKLDGKDYYLVYEKSKIQDWTLLGLVPTDIVNTSMNTLQFTTMLLVGAVMLCVTLFIIGLILKKSSVSLKKKDTEILYRDELFKMCIRDRMSILKLNTESFKKKRPASAVVSTRAARIYKVTQSKITGLEKPLKFTPGTFYDFRVTGAGQNDKAPYV